MREDLFKRMDRLEGMAHNLKKMAIDDAAIKDIEHQITIMGGILRKAKLSILQNEIEAAGAKDIEPLMKRIERLLR